MPSYASSLRLQHSKDVVFIRISIYSLLFREKKLNFHKDPYSTYAYENIARFAAENSLRITLLSFITRACSILLALHARTHSLTGYNLSKSIFEGAQSLLQYLYGYKANLLAIWCMRLVHTLCTILTKPLGFSLFHADIFPWMLLWSVYCIFSCCYQLLICGILSITDLRWPFCRSFAWRQFHHTLKPHTHAHIKLCYSILPALLPSLPTIPTPASSTGDDDIQSSEEKSERLAKEKVTRWVLINFL